MPPEPSSCPRGGVHEWKYAGQASGWRDAEGRAYTMRNYTCKKCLTSHMEKVYQPRRPPRRGQPA